MESIFKYELGVTHEQIITMPAKAKLLSIQVQKGLVQLWALVDLNEPIKGRKIRTIGTGYQIHEYPGEYITTYQLEDGSLVYHVFDGGEV